MAKTTRKKARKAKTTIIAWNDKRIMIEIVDGYDEDRILFGMRNQLGHRDDDPRWQTMEGTRSVTLLRDRLVFSELEA